MCRSLNKIFPRYLYSKGEKCIEAIRTPNFCCNNSKVSVNVHFILFYFFHTEEKNNLLAAKEVSGFSLFKENPRFSFP